MWEERHISNVFDNAYICIIGGGIFSASRMWNWRLRMVLEFGWHHDDSPGLVIYSGTYFEAPLNSERH
jgi:hypothetical protein